MNQVNKLKIVACHRLGRIDAGYDDMREDHYAKLLRDLARKQNDEREAAFDQIDNDLNEASNGYCD